MGTARARTRVIVRTSDQAPHRRRRPWAALLLLVLLALLGGVLVGWERSQAAAIYPGVRIAGVDIGGLSLAEARAHLAPLSRAALDRTITVVAGPRRWSVTPRELGLQINLDGRLQEAYALGREPASLDRYATQLDLVLHGRNLSLVGNYDTGMLQAFVERVAIAVYRPAQPAAVTLQGGRALLTAHAQDGQKLDKAAATALLGAALSSPNQTLVAMPLTTMPAPVGEAEAVREEQSLASILAARLHLHAFGRHWLLGAGVIAPAISLTTVVAPGGTATYRHSVDPRILGRFVDGLAGQIDRPMLPATVAVRGGALAVVAGQSGYHLDTNATLQVLSDAVLQGGEQDITLPVSVTPPGTPTAVAQQTAHQAATLIRRPLTLAFGSHRWTLSPGQLATLLTFTPRMDPIAGPQLDLHVDPARLPAAMAQVDAVVDLSPTSAHFEVRGDRVVLIPAVSGRRVDYVALAGAIEGHGRTQVLPLPTRSYDAALTTAQAQAMGIGDLLLQHATYFPGSSPNRLINIHAAVQHLDGQLIAPGEVFSFNKRIGPITPQGGYVEGINIVDNQDVPGIGGGVCQVAVTLFQAAVYSGMKIIERTPHANIVPYYNPIGMDATVYVSPYGPDVKFQNTTGHWVLISFVEDLPHDLLTVRFFGTNPHFRVVVRGPFVKQRANGAVDAVFYRTVYDRAGKVLLDAHFNSHYVPVTAG